MRAYIHAFQGEPWNEECKAALAGFAKMGIECVLFSTNEELDQRDEGDIVVGGMLIMEHVFNQQGIEVEKYDYPEVLEAFTGRKIWTVQKRELASQELPLFVKPCEEKAAKGSVARTKTDLELYAHLPETAEMYCSEVMNFVSEWRCFVIHGEIIGVQFYNGDSSVMCDMEVLRRAVVAFEEGPVACSLDFGVTDDGRTLLVEVNDGFAIGCYGLDGVLYAKFLMARWMEIVDRGKG